MLRLVFLGAPGSGKGTQSELLSKVKGIPHISTGEMMRAAVASGTPLGEQVKGILDRGELVPDAVMGEVIRTRLSQPDCGNGFVLDGFPRTVAQVAQLDQLLGAMGKPLTVALHLVVPESVLVDRIKARGAAGSGRSDDQGDVALHRLKVFMNQTAPAIELYRKRPIYKEINGLGAIDEIHGRILAATA
jgi:adenylate kinase